MHLLLWLTAGSAALPGSPRTLPALKLRGGGLQQLPHDAKALAKSFVVLGGFDKFVQYLAASETISRPAARKTMHVGAGPLFLLCWPMFSSEATAKNWAMVGPLALTLKAAAAALSVSARGPTIAQFLAVASLLNIGQHSRNNGPAPTCIVLRAAGREIVSEAARYWTNLSKPPRTTKLLASALASCGSCCNPPPRSFRAGSVRGLPGRAAEPAVSQRRRCIRLDMLRQCLIRLLRLRRTTQLC